MNDQTTKPTGVAPPRVTQAERDADIPNILRLTLDRDVDDVDLQAFPMLADQLAQMGDRAMRMELALRCIRLFGMGEIALPHSAAVRDWLRDWIDGEHHGPVGEPLLWPTALHIVTAQLKAWGFENGDGYVVFRGRPQDGELVN